MLKQLETYLQKLSAGGIALAYSGGVDSTLLLAVLARLNRQKPFAVTALTMRTPLQEPSEMLEAEQLAAKFGINQKVLTFNPFSLEAIRQNRHDRCYHCKKAIFTQFLSYARDAGLKYLLDGTNADDLNIYRPGRKALSELGVISPLAELGINKTQIRKMSADLGLPTASKPAIPCLATRFEYDTPLDENTVRRVANGEAMISTLFPQIGSFRLRIHGNLARLEVSKEQIEAIADKAEIIAAGLRKLGFDYITLDLEGFRSGSFDRNLKQN